MCADACPLERAPRRDHYARQKLDSARSAEPDTRSSKCSVLTSMGDSARSRLPCEREHVTLADFELVETPSPWGAERRIVERYGQRVEPSGEVPHRLGKAERGRLKVNFLESSNDMPHCPPSSVGRTPVRRSQSISSDRRYRHMGGDRVEFGAHEGRSRLGHRGLARKHTRKSDEEQDPRVGRASCDGGRHQHGEHATAQASMQHESIVGRARLLRALRPPQER